MNKKILGILVMTLLIATAVLPVVGTMNVLDNRVNNSSLFSEDKEINKRNHCSLHDHDLEIEWERLYGESNDDLFRNVKQTVDGGYICVGVKDGQSHWLLKVDTNGDEEWSATALPNTELWPRCYIVEQTSDGGFVTAGCHEDGIAWGYDRCIWKVDENGNTEWLKVYDDPQLGYHMCIQEIIKSPIRSKKKFIWRSSIMIKFRLFDISSISFIFSSFDIWIYLIRSGDRKEGIQ